MSHSCAATLRQVSFLDIVGSLKTIDHSLLLEFKFADKTV